MIRVFLICLACCCSSLMPLKQSESFISEDHTQFIEKKTKSNYFSGQDAVNFVATDFLSYDFGRIFYDYIKDFESPRTENLSYNRSFVPIHYEFISDSPIGHMHYGGFSYNLWNANSSYSNNTIDSKSYFNLQITINGILVLNANVNSSGYKSFSFTTPSSVDSFVIKHNGDSADLYIIDANNNVFNLVPNTRYTFSFDCNGFNPTSVGGLSLSNLMINVGDYSYPYESYFTGVVQYASLPCYTFTLDKELLFNSQYNGNCYHYVLKFYSRNPNGRPLLFGVDSYVIPHLKWEDSQGNLYGDNFYVSSSMIFNNSLGYNLHNFVYSERSDDSYKPLLNCYVNHKTSEFNSDDYVIAYNDGYDTGYNNGNSTGYQRGYSEGVSYAQEQSSTALTIFTGIIEVGLLPVNVFLKMFEYEVFGINIAGLVSGLITIAMIMILLRFIFGGKQNGK